MNTHATIEELLGNDIFVVATPRLYNEVIRQLRADLRESLETAVEGDEEEKTLYVI
jgi:hypothetical protein